MSPNRYSRHHGKIWARRTWPAALIAAVLAALGTVVAKSHLSTPAPPTPEAMPLHNIENPGPPAQKTASLAPPAATPQPPAAEPAPPPLPATAPEPRTRPHHWLKVRVRAGDTLSAIFKRKGIYSDLNPVLKSGPMARHLTRIYPGQIIAMRIDEDRLLELKSTLTQAKTLQITRAGDEFNQEVSTPPLDIRQTTATGTINQSLFAAGKTAGLSDRLIMEMANIFGWDIDFALDIRNGDRFTVIYDEIYLDGKTLRVGDVQAAEFVNQGKRYRAYRYTTADGKTEYFSEDGRSMRKQFLRTPVSIARISSGFSLGRRHPILNRIRAHKGVDYAAPRGTPIKATGNGRVVFRGRKGGYGNTLILKHGSKYTTLYAHLWRFARGIRNGTRVKQGQVVAYIGSTGLATGPHLHYEFRVNGVHRNPLTVKLPTATPLPRRERADFLAAITPISTSLTRHGGTEMALATQESRP